MATESEWWNGKPVQPISEFTDEYNNEYHLNTIKETLDYLHTTRLKESSEQIDGLIHNLTKVVRLIKGLKK